MTRFCSLVFVIFFYVNLAAQFSSIKLERFTINDGLSNNSINSIVQTKEGYLWIATKDGLNRYDGQSFKVFKTNSLDIYSLPENYVMSLLESKDGILWVGTWGSDLCKYDPIYERFIKINPLSKSEFVQCIFEDNKGNIWYGTTTNGIKCFNPQTGEIKTYNSRSNPPFKIPFDNITGMINDKQNNLWASTWGGGIIKLNPENGDFEQYLENNSKYNSITDNFVWDIGEDNNSNLLVCTNSGLDLLNPATKQFTHNPYIPKKNKSTLTTAIKKTLINHSGDLWIGTYDYRGIYLIEMNSRENKDFIRLGNEPEDPYSLVCNRIRWIYEDRQKNLWIGTEDGLNKLPKIKPFTQFKYLPKRNNSLAGRVVSSIIEGKNNLLWIGYGGNGFNRINLITNSIEHFNQDLKNPNSLNADDVTSLYEDNEGILWIGTSYAGLNKFDPRTKKFKYYSIDPNNPFSIISNWIQQLLETSNGQFLVGTNDGLQVMDRKTEKFNFYKPVIKKGLLEFPKRISVNSLYEDRKKNIWIGTWLDGLFRYDPNSLELFHYMPNSNSNSISGNKVTCITEDSNGNIWIGTYNSGMNKFDKTSGKFIHYTTQDGLPNDVVFGILEDKNKFLWISTLKGLAKFDPIKEKFRIYDEADGIVHNQFNWHAYFKNSSGDLYFGGINGIIKFNPDSIKIESQGPHVGLTSFRVFDKEATLPRSLPTTSKIVLEYNQNFFSIDFNALDLMPLNKHNFAYMLEGIDPQWVHAGSRTTAFYTDIKHGTYYFLVKASNADDIWGEVTTIQIEILPPWWNTWWFRIIAVSIIIVVMVGGYQLRVNQLLKIEKIRFGIASDLHDEIGSNLSSISVDSQALLQSNKLDKTEYELSSDISKTAIETIEAIRDIIWFINPKNDLGEEMVFKMKQTAAKLLVNINWTFEATAGIKMDFFNLEERRNIFLLFKEALTNVVRHSDATNCIIRLTGAAKNFSLIIHDNGIGFDTNNVHQNNGLRNMKIRSEKIGGKLLIESLINNGTKVELHIFK
ncbi:MAG: hypothetical protein FJ214_09105 [Ignavibacteria bacterium]|nr:hypothetical protein [Ignavibacteria bacterium]